MKGPINRSLPALIAITLMGSAAIFWLMPTTEKSTGWTHSVLRNWHDYGLRVLGGKLICNPGGFAALDRPDVYGGHRALSLYPAYATGCLFGQADSPEMPFYLLLTLLVACSIWHLLGRNSFALIAAWTAVFSPGYVRSTLAMDPLGTVVLLGFPFLLCATRLLAAERLTWPRGLVLMAVLALYSALNWTAVFAFGIVGAYLLVAGQITFRRVLLFGAMAGAGTLLVTAVSVIDKVNGGSSATGSAGFQHFYDNYLFGPGGYAGYPMTWSKAAIRLISVNAVGLLPLLALFLWMVIATARRRGSVPWSGLLPLVVALLSIIGLRNYFAHHPWMAGTVIVFGTIFSLALMNQEPRVVNKIGAEPPSQIGRVGAGCALAGSISYGLLIILFLRASGANEEALNRLVQANTSRRDPVVVSPETDPWLVENMRRVGTIVDRRMTVLSAVQSPGTNSPILYLLTGSPRPDDPRLAARSTPDEFPFHHLATHILGWYRRTIARRQTGDRLELQPVYYLYKLP